MADADYEHVAVIEPEQELNPGFCKTIFTLSRIRKTITGSISTLVLVGVCMTILGIVMVKINAGYDCSLSQADIVIALDTSASIGSSNFDKMKSFCKRFLSHTTINTDDFRVAVVTFSENSDIEFDLQYYGCIKDVMQAINDIPYDFKGTGATHTNKALRKIRTTVFSSTRDYRGNVQNVILLLTDGVSKDRQRTMNQAKLAHEDGIIIYAIGIDLTDMSELNGIASERGNALNVQDYDELVDLSGYIFEAFCAETGIQHLQEAQSLGSENETSIRRLSKFKPPSCTAKTDIAFVVDSSSRISQYEFKMQTAFIYDIVDFLNVGKDESRVAALSFSDRIVPQFFFRNYTSKEAVLKAIDTIEFTKGNAAKTGEALDDINTIFFTEKNGDRSNVTDIIVVLTDGEINYDFARSDITSKVTAIRKAQMAAVGIKKRPSYIFIIGIGDVNIEQLNGISSDPDETYTIHVSNFKQLNTDDIRQRLLYRICIVAEFIPKYTTLPETTNFVGPLPNSYTECGMKKLDIVMILDSSTSIGKDGFGYILEFCKKFSSQFDIDSGNVRIGLSTFSNDVNIEFNLNTYNDSNSVYNAIYGTTYHYGDTNVHVALKTMSDTMYSLENGDRKGAQNVAIIITDGILNVNSRRLLKQAKNVREKGIYMFSICVGLEEHCKLDNIAFVPSWNFHKKSYGELLIFNETFFNNFCLELELISSIAYGKQTEQSSNTALAGLAVDGNINTFTHTSHMPIDESPYWSVDLGQEYLITQLDIFNRKDCCGQDLHSLDITVGSHLNNMSLCFHYKGPSHTGEHLVFQCEDKSYGRYVKLTIREKGVLQLAEVNIQGDIKVSKTANIAYGKVANQSTTDNRFAAEQAVDGKKDTFSRTNYQPFNNLPYWWVDLLQIYRLERIEIHNDEICCGENCKGTVNDKNGNKNGICKDEKCKDTISHFKDSPSENEKEECKEVKCKAEKGPMRDSTNDNEKEECKDRNLDSLQVTFGSTLVEMALCKPYTDNTNKTTHFKCEEIEYGRYIMVKLLDAGVLELGEVIVFGDLQYLTYAERTTYTTYVAKGNENRVRLKDTVSDDKEFNWWIDLRQDIKIIRIEINNMCNGSVIFCPDTETETEFSGDGVDGISDMEFSGDGVDGISDMEFSADNVDNATYTNTSKDEWNNCTVDGDIFKLHVVGGLDINDMSLTFKYVSSGVCEHSDQPHQSGSARYIKLRSNGSLIMSIEDVKIFKVFSNTYPRFG